MKILFVYYPVFVMIAVAGWNLKNFHVFNITEFSEQRVCIEFCFKFGKTFQLLEIAFGGQQKLTLRFFGFKGGWNLKVSQAKGPNQRRQMTNGGKAMGFSIRTIEDWQ